MTQHTKSTTLKLYGLDERGNRVKAERTQDFDQAAGSGFPLDRVVIAAAALSGMAGLSFLFSVLVAVPGAGTADTDPLPLAVTMPPAQASTFTLVDTHRRDASAALTSAARRSTTTGPLNQKN